MNTARYKPEHRRYLSIARALFSDCDREDSELRRRASRIEDAWRQDEDALRRTPEWPLKAVLILAESLRPDHTPYDGFIGEEERLRSLVISIVPTRATLWESLEGLNLVSAVVDPLDIGARVGIPGRCVPLSLVGATVTIDRDEINALDAIRFIARRAGCDVFHLGNSTS